MTVDLNEAKWTNILMGILGKPYLKKGLLVGPAPGDLRMGYRWPGGGGGVPPRGQLMYGEVF